ncbi:hypothetical protein [Glycocaulis sp.]|uniref:hypothetical protein n=1 Tax=Glycocaulis sp. TaxID=1969725 RepID=UPI003D1B9CF7
MLPYGKPNTEGEAHLERLAKRVFLDLWTHTSPFRPKTSGTKEKPVELCDLLIVYGNVVLVISEKDIKYPQSGSDEVRWARWHKTSIIKSASQARGAERWLKANPNEVFTDRRLEYSVPNVPADAEIFKILLVRNSNVACINHFGGDTGSFSLYAGPDGYQSPFFVNQIVDGELFHIFCESIFELICRFIDTPEDIINYLRERQKLFLSAQSVYVKGEEGILAEYMKSVNEYDRHSLSKIYSNANDTSYIAYDEDDFQSLYFDERFRRRVIADEVSYAWDRLIDRFGKNMREGTSIDLFNTSLEQKEQGMRYLAMENRTERRLIMEGVVEWAEEHIDKPLAARAMLRRKHASGRKLAYVFLQMDREEPIVEGEYDEYRRSRTSSLFMYMMGLFQKDLETEIVVGIAFENPAKKFKFRSEDIIFATRDALEDEDWESFEKLCQEVGKRPFANSALIEASVSEYPEA